jgi:arabinogalactan endo-1,4-beta-galactosidase
VNATHGAGVFFWPPVISVGSGSRFASVGSVQYLKAELKPTPLAASRSKNS